MKIGYARISSEEQNFDMQMDALEAAGCARIYQERASGAKIDRPELQKALDFMREGDTLVVWRLDRLGRNLKHLVRTVEELREQKKNFSSLNEQIDTGTAAGTLIFHLFCALAEFERGLLRERVNAGLRSARARGRVGGRRRTITDNVILKIVADVQMNPEIPITQICQQHGISRASYYSVVHPRLQDEQRKQEERREIQKREIQERLRKTLPEPEDVK
ncbi:resolvase [Marinobacterium nitratireducens]|uniref:Resolvase n=1 Tax=Marinobacterium nitratireducens TaxID=518897 RepID=A0A917ZAJ3_9GAMM|nr:recombinase family protein [Marinobacterium nitratireducens]GGO77605.1 resolvase [Marinobacterium nitratireducens]